MAKNQKDAQKELEKDITELAKSAEIEMSEIEQQLDNYLQSYEKLKVTLIKLEGAIEVLQNIVKDTEKENK
tara:strand:- start:154 stop:366 length:213 start_codon:yes stop_codon:yes gene_type:complete